MDTELKMWCNNVYNDIITNNKKIVLIAGASASGKSFSASCLCEFLKQKGLSAYCFSADNYYKGISRIIVEKAFLNNTELSSLQSKKEKIIEKVKKVIENSPFTDKFCEKNINLLEEELSSYGNILSKKLITELKLQFDNINFDEPFALNLDKLARDINNLTNNIAISLPEYSFATGESNCNNNLLKNYDVYIVEGLYVLRDEILDNLDKSKICTSVVDCDIKSLLSRRFNRDIKSGRTTYSPEQTIMTTITKTMPCYSVHILPYNKNATHILHTNLTNSEIESKETASQLKFKLSTAQKQALKLLPIEVIKRKKQVDYYFEDNNKNDSDFILRLRVEDGKASKISFKNIINSKQKFEEYDISDFSEENKKPENLINNFLNIGLSLSKVITKDRLYCNYKNEDFKVDIFNSDIFIEIDSLEEATNIINLLNLKNAISGQYLNIIKDNSHDIKYEKEYKFIVNKIPKNIKKIAKISQFYFNFNKKSDFLVNNLHLNLNNVSSARVRVVKQNNSTKYFLTLKSNGNFAREEQEVEISKQTAIYLLKDNIISKISKIRHTTNICNLTFEFDKFENGLLLLEVEVDSPSSYKNIIDVLDYLQIDYTDVTNNQKYKNKNMAK